MVSAVFFRFLIWVPTCGQAALPVRVWCGQEYLREELDERREAVEAMGPGKEWLNLTPRKESLALLWESRNMQLPGMLVWTKVKEAGRTTGRIRWLRRSSIPGWWRSWMTVTSRRGCGRAEVHGLLKADHRASWRAWRGHIVVRVPALSLTYAWCAACGGQYNWNDPDMSLGFSRQCETQRSENFGPTSHLRIRVRTSRVCPRTVGQLETGWDKLVDTIFEGLQEQSRLKITNEVRRFIEVGDLEKNSEAIKVVMRTFKQEVFPSAIIREWVGEALRTGGAWRCAPHQHRQCGEPVDGCRPRRQGSARKLSRHLLRARGTGIGITCVTCSCRRTRKSMFATQVEAARQRPFGNVGGAAESGSLRRRGFLGWREQKLMFMWVSSCVVRERFSCVQDGVCRLAVRADVYCWFAPALECTKFGISRLLASCVFLAFLLRRRRRCNSSDVRAVNVPCEWRFVCHQSMATTAPSQSRSKKEKNKKTTVVAERMTAQSSPQQCCRVQFFSARRPSGAEESRGAAAIADSATPISSKKCRTDRWDLPPQPLHHWKQNWTEFWWAQLKSGRSELDNRIKRCLSCSGKAWKEKR